MMFSSKQLSASLLEGQAYLLHMWQEVYFFMM